MTTKLEAVFALSSCGVLALSSARVGADWSRLLLILEFHSSWGPLINLKQQRPFYAAKFATFVGSTLMVCAGASGMVGAQSVIVMASMKIKVTVMANPIRGFPMCRSLTLSLVVAIRTVANAPASIPNE